MNVQQLFDTIVLQAVQITELVRERDDLRERVASLEARPTGLPEPVASVEDGVQGPGGASPDPEG